jgi:hypothetical protein
MQVYLSLGIRICHLVAIDRRAFTKKLHFKRDGFFIGIRREGGKAQSYYNNHEKEYFSYHEILL